jgi:glycosyltransferase involved in cell wall biosynthesis
MKNILALIHLPPPIHGASLTGDKIRIFLKQHFILEIQRQSLKNNTNDNAGFNHVIVLINKIFKLFKNLVFNNYDIIYITPSSNGITVLRDLLYIWMIKSLTKSRLIIHFHSNGYFLNKYIPKIIKERTLNNSTILVPSHSTKMEIEQFNLKNVKIEILYGYVNSFDIDLPKLRKTPVLLFYSNLYRSKGIIEFIDVIKQLERLNSVFSFKIYGSYTDFTKKELEEIIKSKDIISEFQILGPIINNEIEVLKDCNILISPTYYETFGLSVLECMSLGIVPVTSNIGGLSEIIIDKKNGFLIQNLDVLSFANKVNHLLLNKELLLKMSFFAKESSVNKFSKLNFENKLKEIFNVI